VTQYMRSLVYLQDAAGNYTGSPYDVFLAKKGSPDAREHVGTISWFGAFRHHGTSGPVKKTLTYDVTEALRALGGAELSGAGLTVIVEATEGRDSSDPAAAAASRTSAAAAFRAESKLSIGAIELQAAPMPPK